MPKGMEEIPWRISVGGGCQDLLNKVSWSLGDDGAVKDYLAYGIME